MRSRATAGALAVACGLLALAAFAVNRWQGCAVHDAPYAEAWCAPDADSDPEALRARLRRNPGDIEALRLLVRSAPPEHAGPALRELGRLWPHDAQVLHLRAADALSRGEWAGAAEPLIQLVAYHDSDPAAGVAARLIGAGHGALFEPFIDSSARWLRRVLQAFSTTGVPPAAAAPLVSRALAQRAIEPAIAGGHIQQLKASRAWTDAHGLWTALHGEAVPVLYNPGFDQPFRSYGFDWEILPQPHGARAGAAVERAAGEKRGMVLAVRLTGRRFANPLVRQHLLLAGAPQRLRGEYVARQLRMDKGLVWAARCPASGALAGRSAPLLETGRRWMPFQFDIVPPPDCGPVVSLQLETSEGFEAETGAVGQLEFDSFTLEPR